MSINVSETSLRLSVSGDLLSTNAEDIRSKMFADLKRAESNVQRVDVDLSRAAMVDSVGLNLVVSVIKYVKERGGTIRLLIGNNNVERTFRFTRLDSQAELVRV